MGADLADKGRFGESCRVHDSIVALNMSPRAGEASDIGCDGGEPVRAVASKGFSDGQTLWLRRAGCASYMQ